MWCEGGVKSNTATLSHRTIRIRVPQFFPSVRLKYLVIAL